LKKRIPAGGEGGGDGEGRSKGEKSWKATAMMGQAAGDFPECRLHTGKDSLFLFLCCVPSV
jgi:hypothetical protein